ncbi:MAG: preprotein translocase subunit YajC [bacterium]|nr:preprotein translocase subunit YajC [bacterium]
MEGFLPWLRLAHALGGGPGQGGEAAPGGFAAPFLTFGLLIGIFYFLLIRPQQKQRKDHAKMLETLKKGDEVVTQGGIHGSVYKIKDNTVSLEVADGVRLRVSKSAITSMRGKPTDKEKAAD